MAEREMFDGEAAKEMFSKTVDPENGEKKVRVLSRPGVGE